MKNKRIIIIPTTDPRLKRHINHDPRSRKFAFDSTGLDLKSVRHACHIATLNQRKLGKCTAETGIGILGTDPFYSTLIHPPYALNDNGSNKLYNEEQTMDGHGVYPPNDFGSSGLTLAKCLLKAKVISGYDHTFTLKDALLALTLRPIAIGVNWYSNMFSPDSTGKIKITGSLEGGHEFKGDEMDVPNELIWCQNSWGNSWGVKRGRFCMTFDDFGTLLERQGDVVVFRPLNK